VCKYSAAVNSYTALNVTKLDVLDTFPIIKVAVGYYDPDGDEELASFPASLDKLERVEVRYKEFKGWETVCPSQNKRRVHFANMPRLPPEQRHLRIYLKRHKTTW
jgi:adenylosuccinate synthase